MRPGAPLSSALLGVSALVLALACFALWLRARAAAALRRRVLDDAPEALLLCDRAARCHYANERAAALLGREAHTLVGGTLAEALGADAGAVPLADWLAAIAAGRAWPGSHPGAQARGLTARILPCGALTAVWLARAHPEMARIRHDLVQPLGAIANYAELIRGLPAGDDGGYAAHILRIAGQLAARVRDS